MIALSDAERYEICNLLAGAIARHVTAKNVLYDTWQATLHKLTGADTRVFVENPRIKDD